MSKIENFSVEVDSKDGNDLVSISKSRLNKIMSKIKELNSLIKGI